MLEAWRRQVKSWSDILLFARGSEGQKTKQTNKAFTYPPYRTIHSTYTTVYSSMLMKDREESEVGRKTCIYDVVIQMHEFERKKERKKRMKNRIDDLYD